MALVGWGGAGSQSLDLFSGSSEVGGSWSSPHPTAHIHRPICHSEIVCIGLHTTPACDITHHCTMWCNHCRCITAKHMQMRHVVQSCKRAVQQCLVVWPQLESPILASTGQTLFQDVCVAKRHLYKVAEQTWGLKLEELRLLPTVTHPGRMLWSSPNSSSLLLPAQVQTNTGFQPVFVTCVLYTGVILQVA